MLRPAAGIMLFATLGAALIGAACGGGSGTTVTERTVGARTFIPKPTLEASSGFPEVDAVIAAALVQDDIELAGLTGYQTLPCETAEEAGDGPECREGESPGTEVEVLAATTCENGWVRPEAVPDAYKVSFAPDPPELIAVYTPRFNDSTFGGGFGATAVAVFKTGVRENGLTRGAALYINKGRTVWIRGDCADLVELLDPAGIDAYLIAPPGADAAPTDDASAAETPPPDEPGASP
ncbi:MAG: hypothetical protein HY873_03760 [Chloroflexi bacterium]|nr:hypothetical protein [Chloroflexota bacterium]